MELKHILGFLTFFLFLVVFHKSENKKKAYVAFMLCLFPFIELHLTNETLGLFTVFDGISFYALFFFYKDFLFGNNIRSIYFLLFCSLTIILLISCLQSEFINKCVVATIKYISIFIYAKILVGECQTDPPFANKVVKYLRVACLFSIVFLVMQLIIGLKFTFYPELNPNTQDNGGTRYPSFFFDAQVYSQFLGMSSFFFLMKTGLESSGELLLNRLCFFLVIVVIFLTGGRAGFMGLCAGMVIIFLSGGTKFQLLIAACVVAGFIIIVSFPQTFVIFNREDGVNDSLDVRTRIWGEALGVFKINPMWGIGVGNYQNYNLKHFNFRYYILDGEIIYYGTENGYLNMLAECGMLGLINVFTIVLIPVITAVRLFLKKQANYNVFFLIAGVFAWMTAFSTSNTLDDKRIVVLLATLLCLLISLKKNPEPVYV